MESNGITGIEKLMTVKELAEITRLAVGTINHWVAEGRVPVVRFGSRVLFRPSEIYVWIKEHYCPATKTAAKGRHIKQDAEEPELFSGEVKE
ncbi:hypothetical protein FACS189485_08150 [Spirochaetia bacterium]|nr:hypothetical protein FACS189485_08150 [Spirochaetia bacterium]